MTRHEEVSEQDVLHFLSRAAKPTSVREIADELELRHRGRRDLHIIMEKLKRKGDIVEAERGRYALPGRKPKAAAAKPAATPRRIETPRDVNLITGRVVAHRDGYGFVVPDRPVPGMEGDLFVGRDRLGDAMHGDTVAARIERHRADGRAEGRVVRIVKRAHPTVVGVFHYGERSNNVTPYDTRLVHDIHIPPGHELTPALREKIGAAPMHRGAASATPRRRLRFPELDEAVVNVELTRFPRGGAGPEGRVVEILGRQGDFAVDVEIIIRKHHLPDQFPDDVQAEARATPQQVREADLHRPAELGLRREDFRHLPIVTIDGETAKDFDDAVHVARLPGGHYELQVHIADVGHYVARGSALDREARLRGTSVYFPDRAVPMLPEALSNAICSLNPKVDRLVMSVVMEFDAQGALLRARFTPGVIRSAERMTYTNVNKVVEGNAEASERYAALGENFRLMRELALLLNAKRTKRGSIDFDLPEPVIEFDALGRMVKIIRSERNIAHRIIEEFMLAANEAVASYLESSGIASLHRVHEKPDPKKVLEFEELARAFGYTLGVANLSERRLAVKHGKVRDAARAGRPRQMTVALPGSLELDIRPQHYQRLTQKIADKPEERILSYLMLRSLKQARYAAEPLGHFALATGEYTHFTSPIRRYPDLIVHRALKWALKNQEAKRSGGKEAGKTRTPEAAGPYRKVELEEIALESSEAERRADAAERELMDWKTARFMEAHLGEEYDAIVISILKFGIFVELLEIFVEGLVPIETLEETLGERCLYRERDRAIVTGHGRTAFRLGDRVRARADRVDHFRMRVEFSVVGKRQDRTG
jgi:ribonuclease R